ncbi:flavin-containing monooxygenase [Haliangium sp.]|uniref:flavin-containing monooxygenase n=1 Tax=Haliangium sp. TaxID=2663208 RepID=UPI003D0F4D4F
MVTNTSDRDGSRPGGATPGTEFDVIIVGAGFAGLYMLHRARELGLSARVFEAGGGVGGTWYWNRYPGARCDVESLQYSYQFSDELQQEWHWTERYASQPEILRYLEHVADRFALRPDIQLDTRVEAAIFDEASGRWRVETSADTVTARFVVMATGCLSSANIPEIEGRDEFAGATYHTGRWPHEGVDFTGQRVGVIGTGSSGIQCIPIIAEQAEHLYVFQRTPSFSVPARNAPLDPAVEREIKATYHEFREAAAQTPFGIAAPISDKAAMVVSPEERERTYEEYWQTGGLGFMVAFADLLFSREANETAAEFMRRKIRATVTDPAVADALCPDTVVGCKRLCLDTAYFETFNRANVTLVDLNQAPIERITADGIRADGEEYRLDSVVFATGFDAMTGALERIDIRGVGGRALRDKWAEGPRTYLGLATAGFPNLFTITGPGSPSVLSNMVPSIEQHVNWIADCVAYMRDHGMERIEPTVEAEEAWGQRVNQIANMTLYTSCNSWYLGANIPGKPRVFMPYIGFPEYVATCRDVAANDYQGFTLARSQT